MGAPRGNKNAAGKHSTKTKSSNKVSKNAWKVLQKNSPATKEKERQKFWIKAARKRKK